MKIPMVCTIILFSCTFFFTEAFAQSLFFPADFGTIVYKFADRYYVKDSHDVLTSNDSPDIVIKTAIDRGGDIYIASGTYNLSQYFSGFDLKTGTHLKLAPDTTIVVPSGYQSYVFRLKDGTAHCVIEGGKIYETYPVKRNWIGIMMQGGTSGVYFNLIENMYITDPYIVIDFNATRGQWINANTFVNIQSHNFVRGIEFEFKGKHTNGLDGFDGNVFRDSQFQSGSMTTYGVKDIKHGYNAFYNVQVWDLPPGSISSTIDSSADDTIIIGGQMTYQGFTDAGRNTIILDSWHSKILLNSASSLAIISGTYQPESNLPTLQSNQAIGISIAPQSLGFVKDNHAQIVVSQGLPSEINIHGSVSNSKGGKVILHITRPDGVVELNQAYITSDGKFYYPMTLDKNSLIGQYVIEILYQNSNLGSLFLDATSSHTKLNEIHPNMSAVSSFETNTTSFTSIKNSAQLWSQNQISDDIFVSDIQYLAKIGLIEIPNENQSITQLIHIPKWLRNNAGLWADGKISASDFISEIQYLLNNKIIQIAAK